MNTLKKGLILGVAAISTFCGNPTKNNPNAEIDRKVDSLLSIMTLDEKIGQLSLYTSDMDQTGAFLRPQYIEDIKAGKVGSIFNAYGTAYTRKLQEMAVNETRLGIPLLFGYDVIHGHRTIFPVPLAEASSWDLKAIKTAAEVAAREASAEGLHWTFAPMADIARDPRWGRMVEGSGEDPYLGSLIAAERVKGFQGTDIHDLHTIAACVKHFAAYGAAQAGRDYHTVDMSDRLLREVYLPAYKAALDAGALTVMTSFNDLNGIPATANKYLFDEILRKEWGFEGFVVTDYTAIMELLYHGVAKDAHEASALALNAGVDMSMQDGFYMQTLADLVKQGKVTEKQIDIAAGRILRVKFQLGLFEDPYRYSDPENEKAEIMKSENIAAAHDMAKKSIVLLKNEKQLLPLSKKTKTIAVIGPLADSKRDMIGSWSAAGDWAKSISLLDGLKKKLPNAKFLYAKGAEITGNDTKGFADAVNIAKKADVVIMAVGEGFWMSGEAASRSEIDLPGVQEDLVKAVSKTGTPMVAVLMNGRPLTINWLDENVPAILETWFLGTTAGDAIADVLVGDYNPSGKLPVTFPKNVGQIPIYHSMKNTGRPFDANNKYTSKYLDVSNEPLYVFGYGLSYTKFEYGAIQLSSKEMKTSDKLTVKITLTNAGKMDGEEVVQLYIKDKVASASRAVRELKDFQKVFLKAGESRELTFTIDNEDLSFYRADMSWGSEPGEFVVFIGGNSRDTKSAEFVLN
ncbi:glycosyl hydrolase [bacterium]|nr:MAG: glycosyl hydrolase [bacterium]